VPDLDTILASASAAAHTELSDPVDLGGNERTTVLRCRTSEGTTVVVNSTRPTRCPRSP
jgi:hypothetical protein